MEDFVIMSVKNFSYAQNYQNWKDVESFMFFSLYMYTNNANSKQKQRVLCTIRFFN